MSRREKPRRPGEFVRAGELARYRLLGAEGEPSSRWVTVRVLGPDDFGGFTVRRADASRQVTHFASAEHFESYTGVYWAGWTALSDAELAILASPPLSDRPRFYTIAGELEELRRALAEVGDRDPRLAAALRHDIAYWERLLGDLLAGRERRPVRRRAAPLQPELPWST